MSLEQGLIISFIIVGLSGIGMAAFLLWLRKRDSDHHHKDLPAH